MASFRTHISFGLGAGILGVIGLVGAAIADAPGFLIGVGPSPGEIANKFISLGKLST